MCRVQSITSTVFGALFKSENSKRKLFTHIWIIIIKFEFLNTGVWSIKSNTTIRQIGWTRFHLTRLHLHTIFTFYVNLLSTVINSTLLLPSEHFSMLRWYFVPFDTLVSFEIETIACFTFSNVRYIESKEFLGKLEIRNFNKYIYSFVVMANNDNLTSLIQLNVLEAIDVFGLFDALFVCMYIVHRCTMHTKAWSDSSQFSPVNLNFT